MKVLVADDNEDFLFLITELLKHHGHSPMIARDGKEAREILADERFDAIISDVFMPGLDGVRFHSYVRDFLGEQSVPFIFISGMNDAYTQEGLQDSGVDFFLDKTAVGEIVPILTKIEAALAA